MTTFIALLLAVSMLSGCSSAPVTNIKSTPAEFSVSAILAEAEPEAVTYTVELQTVENTAEAEDGTLLAHYKLELPVMAAVRDKHAPLNNSLPMEAVPDVTFSPEDSLLDREADNERLYQLKQQLSPLEQHILSLYLSGLTYGEIGAELNRPVKSIDNAIQRIRRKVAP